MRFCFYKKREKFLDYFRPKKKVEISYKRTLTGKGFKSNVVSDSSLAKQGETAKIIRMLSEGAINRNSEVPFALTKEIERKLGRYEIRVGGLETVAGLFPKKCEKAGIKITDYGKYEILD